MSPAPVPSRTLEAGACHAALTVTLNTQGMRGILATGLLALASAGHAEQYVLSTEFNVNQPAAFRATLNGRTVMLHRNANGSLDITPWVKKGKNTLVVEATPGKNTNRFSKSVLTLGAGQNSKWRTLFKKEVGRDTLSRKDTFVFMGHPSAGARPGKVSLSSTFNSNQPVAFEVVLNGETISSMESKGNVDLTPFLKSGKNTVTVRYEPGKNTNQFSKSVLTLGQQLGTKWNSLLKLGIGKPDAKPGSVTFALYR